MGHLRRSEKELAAGGPVFGRSDGRNCPRGGGVVTVIRFPFPDWKLSGNSRTAHRYLTSERQAAREIGAWLTQASGLRLPAVPLELSIVVCPPDKRTRDDDNLLTAFKSYRDGMFQKLGLNDRLVRRTVIEWSDVEEGGALYVTLKEIGA